MHADSDAARDTLCFEQPLNERTRTYLRLEFLFSRMRHHRADNSDHGRRATLSALLDILLMLGRSDIKGDLVKGMTEQRKRLAAFSDRPGVDAERLAGVLANIDEKVSNLHGMSTQFAGAILRDNDFLVSIANRSAIPGGTCGFDLPNLHHWLDRPEAHTGREIDAWAADLVPFEDAVRLDLALARDSRPIQQVTAQAGSYVQSLPEPARMLRVVLPRSAAVYPEISAGKQRFSIRLIEQRDVSKRGQQSALNLSFGLACCPAL